MSSSPYQTMWLLALFDLPVDTKAARKAATNFRKRLLENGFSMLQYSVYARYCPSEEKARTQRNRVKRHLPPDGEVRLISLTDVQYGKMFVFHGKMRKTPESAPKQIEMF